GMRLTGPLDDGTNGYELLFGDLPMRQLNEGEKGGVSLEAVEPYSAPPVGGPPLDAPFVFPRSPIKSVTVEVDSSSPHRDAERLLRNFIQTSYRRPVEERDVPRFLGLFERAFSIESRIARS